MTDKTLTDKRSSRVQVLEAIHALHDQEMEITCASIVRHTGLKVVTVNDCIKELKEREEIWSPERGVYRPIQRHEPSEVVIMIALPTGHVKWEKGDQMIEFTPKEWRLQVAPMAAGACAQTAVIEHTHQTIQLVDQVRKLRRQVEGLQAKLAADPAQRDLLEEESPV
ncbi:MAG: hypothetical protein J7556_15015 [Acidovorax sp.]|nr:hypothetical protein [Acidovorax sp.]